MGMIFVNFHYGSVDFPVLRKSTGPQFVFHNFAIIVLIQAIKLGMISFNFHYGSVDFPVFGKINRSALLVFAFLR